MTKIGYSMLGLRKPNFNTKIIPFEKFHNAGKFEKGDFSRFFYIHYVAKFQKNEGDSLESLKKFNDSLIVLKKLKKKTLWDFLTFVLLQNMHSFFEDIIKISKKPQS